MEATADLALEEQPLRTPLESTTGEALAQPVVFVPILRAGLGMLDAALELVPEALVGHLGVFRDEETLEPVEYYAKFPPQLPESTVLLLDPMLATGGSAIAAVNRLRARGAGDIRLVVLIAAPEGLAAFTTACPDVPVFTGAVDRQLNERGYILPGLGDAGDRLFATT
jgi:uracil phosphoribosyltransferase